MNTCVRLALLIATAARPLAAQLAGGPHLTAGDRVRVWSNPLGLSGAEFRYSVTRSDTLWLSGAQGEKSGVPLTGLTRLDVHRQGSRFRGVVAGTLLGGVLGVAIGIPVGRSEAQQSDGLSVAGDPIVLGAIGAVIGLVTGAGVSGDRWRTVWPAASPKTAEN